MNKKQIRLPGLLSLSLVLVLAACAPVRDYTPDPEPVPPTLLSNPINEERIVLAEVPLEGDLLLTVTQEGVGYKTDRQVTYWETFNLDEAPVAAPEVVEETETESTEEEVVEADAVLVENTRVVAIGYTITNNSNANRNVISFDYRSGYYLTGNLDTEYAYYDETPNSLHVSGLGLNTYPSGWDAGLQEYNLAPGESATWVLDWGMPNPLPEDGILVFSQNFLYNQVWYPDILLELNLFVGETNE